jgi:multiple sugar transport system substrate-binding protein
MGCWSIWKFAQNKANAHAFLVDLLLQAKTATIQSQLYNFPTFAHAFPFKAIRKVAAKDPHKPHGKYVVLTKIAEKYTHNIGWPGTVNPAMDEVFSTFLIPQMFAQVSQGKKSAADSVSETEHQIKTIYKKWEKRGKI